MKQVAIVAVCLLMVVVGATGFWLFGSFVGHLTGLGGGSETYGAAIIGDVKPIWESLARYFVEADDFKVQVSRSSTAVQKDPRLQEMLESAGTTISVNCMGDSGLLLLSVRAPAAKDNEAKELAWAAAKVTAEYLEEQRVKPIRLQLSLLDERKIFLASERDVASAAIRRLIMADRARDEGFLAEQWRLQAERTTELESELWRKRTRLDHLSAAIESGRAMHLPEVRQAAADDPAISALRRKLGELHVAAAMAEQADEATAKSRQKQTKVIEARIDELAVAHAQRLSEGLRGELEDLQIQLQAAGENHEILITKMHEAQMGGLKLRSLMTKCAEVDRMLGDIGRRIQEARFKLETESVRVIR